MPTQEELRNKEERLFKLYDGLLTKYRKQSAIGLILLLIAVFPANLFLIQSEEAQIALNIDKNTAIIRAPFQLLFLAIALI